MEAGTFNDLPNFDPVVTGLLTQDNDLSGEGIYLAQQLYPVSVASFNRFLTVDGTVRQRLVVNPVQFQATGLSAPTVGTLRLYDNLDLVVYTAPFSETDFEAPNVWAVEAAEQSGMVNFSVQVDDLSGIHRVLLAVSRFDRQHLEQL